MKNNLTRTTSLIAAAGLAALMVLVAWQRPDRPATEGDAANPPVLVSAGDYTIDAAHSEVGFRVKHLGISTVRGVFNEADASITFPEGDLRGLQAAATIDAASIHTNEADRDDHLRSADFFDVEKHPEIAFTSSGVKSVDGSSFTLAGDLTIRGITKPVTLDAEFLGSATDPWGNERAAFTAEGKINRKDFGLTWNKALEAGGFLVGDEVTIVLDVQAIKDAQ